MRRAAAALLAPFWAFGAITAATWALIRWAGAAAADGYSSTLKWRWAPAAGAAVFSAIVVVGVMWVW